MNQSPRRPCPICGGLAGEQAFPYATRFNDLTFDYVRCRCCASVFVDPIPDVSTFALMYAKASYHDAHYIDCKSGHYGTSARLLRDYLPPGASVLDYGCGLGLFVQALHAEGFSAIGVEYDEAAVAHAAKITGRPILSVAEFMSKRNMATYDALHLGDVLEHLPDPCATLSELLRFVKPGGLLFAEGPLENNPSPVYWAARLFGAVKRGLRPNFTGSSPPTHLVRVNAAEQLAFFMRVAPNLSRLYWNVYETGWPYSTGSALKRTIAVAALFLGGKRVMGATFGNRFHGMFRLPPQSNAIP
jgi:2-polyprenyl-3-methyl-5-hydroxy-6-metoxy-1,4-benzoquinol methylase